MKQFERDGSPPGRRCSRAAGWVLAALVIAQGSPASADSLMDLQIELAELVEQGDDASRVELEAQVEKGLPPDALVAMLDACRAHPRSDLEPMLRTLAQHRTVAIRARAMLAWAELGPAASVEAIQAAADDLDRGVRRLAVVLSRLHPSERGDAIVAELLRRDSALAEELAPDALQDPESEPS